MDHVPQERRLPDGETGVHLAGEPRCYQSRIHSSQLSRQWRTSGHSKLGDGNGSPSQSSSSEPESGPDFCGNGVCQSGNCTKPPGGHDDNIPWQTGNTADGTCGGDKRYTCDIVVGNCCNKDGKCESLPSDCGSGWYVDNICHFYSVTMTHNAIFSLSQFGRCTSSTPSSLKGSR